LVAGSRFAVSILLAAGAVEVVVVAVAVEPGMPGSRISHSAFAVTNEEAQSRKAVARSVFMFPSVVLEMTSTYGLLFARPCANSHIGPDRCAPDHIATIAARTIRRSEEIRNRPSRAP
jgi:hypothetical protein